MKILIDIGHPAHVHYFKNLAKYFITKGHKILFTTRDKEVAISLLKYENFDYISFGRPYKTKFGKMWALFYFTFRLMLVAIKYKPDIILNATHYSAWVSFLLRKPHISIEDSFNMEQVSLILPFTNAIITPSFPHKSLGYKEVMYNGYQELYYLHKDIFKKTIDVRSLLNIKDEKIVLLRFVSWNASHDIGASGIDMDFKRKFVTELSKYARVIISSEQSLDSEFEQYQYRLPPQYMHDLLIEADLFIGEGATMASEAAVLGTPSIYINTIERGYITDAADNYGLSFHMSNGSSSLDKAIELIKTDNLKDIWQEKLQKFYEDKINPTDFLIWFVENYPISFKIMKENPDYQLRFK